LPPVGLLQVDGRICPHWDVRAPPSTGPPGSPRGKRSGARALPPGAETPRGAAQRALGSAPHGATRCGPQWSPRLPGVGAEVRATRAARRCHRAWGWRMPRPRLREVAARPKVEDVRF
jgi:hypothetical protein